MTLRKLHWMAIEKKRVAGQLAAFQVASIASMFGAAVDPDSINPFGEANVMTRANAELLERDNREASLAKLKRQQESGILRNAKRYPIVEGSGGVG